MVEKLVMDRIPESRKRGQRELWIVGLLVLPLVVLGFVLAAMGVLVDPPPDPTPTSTAEQGSPVVLPGTPAATPAPGAGIDRPATHRLGLASSDLFTIVA